MNQKTRKNILFFFTSNYPYSKREIFIENEVPILLKKFDKLVIISGAKELSESRPISKNIELVNIPYLGRLSLGLFFKTIIHPYFFKELLLMVFLNKKLPTLGRLKTIIITLSNAIRLKKKYIVEINKINNNYKKILYNFWFNDTTVALGLLKQKFPKLITVSRTHRWDLYFSENKYNYLPFRNQTSKDLNCIYSASTNGINYCKKVWKVKESKIKLSRLGVKQQIFIPADDRKILISCSNVISIKRVDKIIQVLRLVKTKNLKWIHFGVGSEFEKVRVIAKNLLLNKISYEFLGQVKNQYLLDWYKKNNPSLFINLSISEGIPVSIMEAMSFGIPCIATKVGGSEELVSKDVGFPIDKNETNKSIAKIIESFFKLSVKERNVLELKVITT